MWYRSENCNMMTSSAVAEAAFVRNFDRSARIIIDSAIIAESIFISIISPRKIRAIQSPPA